MLIMSLAAALIATAPVDTVVLEQGHSFLWFRRPAAQLVVNSPADIRLILTSRDPQFFAVIKMALHPTADPASVPVAEMSSDSSSVDSRSNTNRHTLYFRLTPEQLAAWSAGTAPTLRLGKLTVTLSADGRNRLATAARSLRPRTE